MVLLEVTFLTDQVGQFPQNLEERGGVLCVLDSDCVGHGNHLVVHIQISLIL